MSVSRTIFGAISSNLRRLQSKFIKMTTLEQIIENNKIGEESMKSLKMEIEHARRHILSEKKRKLNAENTALKAKVEELKSLLITLETNSGRKQVAVPGARTLCTQAVQAPTAPTNAVEANNKTDSNHQSNQPKEPNAAKEKKPKKEKPKAVTAETTEPLIDVGRLDMRVGKIIEVTRHPDADSLYLEKIDCGEPQPRTVVSGLVKFVPIEEMQNRMVIVLCNLKPAKMRGVTSEAMVMCASTPEKVEVLSPPTDAVPGDMVHCDGYTRQPDAQLNPKKKIFETCAPDLMTNSDLIACYKGANLHVPGKGNVVAQTLKNVHVK